MDNLARLKADPVLQARFQAHLKQQMLKGIWKPRAVEYSFVCPVGYVWSKPLVRAIREFDAGFVPVWVRRVYQTPAGSLVVRGYHILGRHILNSSMVADGEIAVTGLRPTNGWPYIGPIYQSRTLELQEGTEEIRHLKKQFGHPGLYVPFDDRVLRAVRKMWWRVRAREKGVQLVEQEQLAGRDSKEAALQKVSENRRLALKDEEKTIKRYIAEGKLGDPEPSPKPFMVVGKYA
jgi:hypothetical protein